MPKLNDKQLDVVRQWKADMLSEEGPRFNIDYPVLEREGSPNDPLRFEGDPGFFLAYHFADIQDDTELSEWMSDKSTEELITRYTGIPLADAKALVEPKALWAVDYPTEKITAREFIGVLDLYLETGQVLWEKIIIDQQRAAIETNVLKKVANVI